MADITPENALISLDAAAAIPKIFRGIRTSHGWSRAQVARRLRVSEPVIYNMELGRTRITLSCFFEFLGLARIDLAEALAANIFSIQSKSELKEAVQAPGVQSTALLISMFRSRLKLSQKEFAKALGYSSSSMCHHFEKGIREATILDLLKLMALAQDNTRGFILAICNDNDVAVLFPEGFAAQMQTWEEYWSDYYISAVRQIMRSDSYRNFPRYRLGFFSDVLGITVEQEQHALAVLGKLGIAKFQGGKPMIDPSVRILIPQNVSPDILTKFKMNWVNYGTKRFQKDSNPGDLLSVDLIHANPEIFARVIKMIRKLQDDVHNLPLQDTKGFMCLGWMGSYTPV